MKSLTMRYSAASVRDLNDMREFLERAVITLGGSEDDAGDLVLAVNEAVTNVILHGYGGEPGPVALCVEAAGGSFSTAGQRRFTNSRPPCSLARRKQNDANRSVPFRPRGFLGAASILSVFSQVREGSAS